MILCKFRDDFGDLYKMRIFGISKNSNQFTYLRSASGVNGDVIKMAAIALLILMYVLY